MLKIKKTQPANKSALLLALLFWIEKNRECMGQHFLQGKEIFLFSNEDGDLRIKIVPGVFFCRVYVNENYYRFGPFSGAGKLIEELYRDQERSPLENLKP
jgi:hypothetical protein